MVNLRKIKTIRKINHRRVHRASVSSRSRFVPLKQIRADITLKALELAPYSLSRGGFISTQQLASILGAPTRSIRPILKDLMDKHKLNGYHSQRQEFWRARQREVGDPSA